MSRLRKGLWERALLMRGQRCGAGLSHIWSHHTKLTWCCLSPRAQVAGSVVAVGTGSNLSLSFLTCHWSQYPLCKAVCTYTPGASFQIPLSVWLRRQGNSGNRDGGERYSLHHSLAVPDTYFAQWKKKSRLASGLGTEGP